MTQVYITPSQEQLNQFIKEDPLFIQKVKDNAYQLLLEKSSEYVSYRLNNEAQNTFNKLFEAQKSKYFKKDSYGYSSFSSEIEKGLSEKINTYFKENLEKELLNYLNSDSFKSTINHKVKEKMTQYVLEMLDEQIKDEAKKLVA